MMGLFIIACAAIFLILLISAFSISLITVKTQKSEIALFFVFLSGIYLAYLAAIGANIGYKYAHDYFAPDLYTAIEMNNLHKVKKAVKRGENYLPTNEPVDSPYFESPLETAVRMADQDIIHYLVELGVPVDELSIVQATKLNRYETLRYLLENGGNPDSSYYIGRTALFYAHSPETIDVLLDFNADPNKLSDEKRSPLMEAAVMCNRYKIESLLKAGARIDIIDERGYSALMFATRCSPDIVKKLITRKIINNKNYRGLSVLSLFSERDNPIQLILSNYSDIECSGTDPIQDYLKNLDLLLSAGADPDARDNDGYTPLSRLFTNRLISGIEFRDPCSEKYSDIKKYVMGFEQTKSINDMEQEYIPTFERVRYFQNFIRTKAAQIFIKHGANLDLPFNDKNGENQSIVDTLIEQNGIEFIENITAHEHITR